MPQNDLSYYMGYKIRESYFNKQDNKIEAIKNILHIKKPANPFRGERILK